MSYKIGSSLWRKASVDGAVRVVGPQAYRGLGRPEDGWVEVGDRATIGELDCKREGVGRPRKAAVIAERRERPESPPLLRIEVPQPQIQGEPNPVG